MLIDDAHWLDRASAEALLFAIRRLVADPIAVLLAVRDGEPSLLDGADLPTVQIAGLSRDETASLLPSLAPETAAQLHEATAGNPLGLLELARDADELALAPGGAPLLVSARISRAFLRRTGDLDERERQALLLAATSDSGDLAVLERAAKRLSVELSALAAAERTWHHRRAGRFGRVPPSAGALGDLRRRATGGKARGRTGRLPPPCPIATSTAARGIWPPRLRVSTSRHPPHSSRPERGRATGAPTRAPRSRSSAPGG